MKTNIKTNENLVFPKYKYRDYFFIEFMIEYAFFITIWLITPYSILIKIHANLLLNYVIGIVELFILQLPILIIINFTILQLHKKKGREI